MFGVDHWISLSVPLFFSPNLRLRAKIQGFAPKLMINGALKRCIAIARPSSSHARTRDHERQTRQRRGLLSTLTLKSRRPLCVVFINVYLWKLTGLLPPWPLQNLQKRNTSPCDYEQTCCRSNVFTGSERHGTKNHGRGCRFTEDVAYSFGSVREQKLRPHVCTNGSLFQVSGSCLSLAMQWIDTPSISWLTFFFFHQQNCIIWQTDVKRNFTRRKWQSTQKSQIKKEEKKLQDITKQSMKQKEMPDYICTDVEKKNLCSAFSSSFSFLFFFKVAFPKIGSPVSIDCIDLIYCSFVITRDVLWRVWVNGLVLGEFLWFFIH